MTRLIRVTAITAVTLTASIMVTAGLNRPVDAEPKDPRPVVPSMNPTPSVPPPPAPVRLNPDPMHRSGDLIEVSIDKQRLTAWRDGAIVFRFVISTGRPGYETPTGHYKILDKTENRWSRKWSVWMPYAMRWHEGYFIHQLPHKDGSSYNIGASKLGTPDSHGCVRVNVGDAERLFNWTAVGTPVWVH